MSEAVGPFLPGPNDTPEYGIYAGECSALMAKMPDNCIPLTITSPPYDNLRVYNGYVFDFEAIAQQLWRVTRPGGVVVWVVADATVNGSETGTSFRQALYFQSLGFNMETMVYDTGYQGAKGSNWYYWQAFEFMFVFAKGRPAHGERIRDHINLFGGTRNTSTRRQRDGSRVNERFITPVDSVRTNVWYYPTGGSISVKDEAGYEHPAPFPEDLARDQILSWSNPGDLVFDPMIGSGTVAKMSKILSRRWLGFDISPAYVDMARRRLLEYTNPPLPLFGAGGGATE